MWKIWCEWEMGFEGVVYPTEERAREAAKECFQDQLGSSWENDYDDAIADGLLSFEELEVG